jgi:hypothetical protein
MRWYCFGKYVKRGVVHVRSLPGSCCCLAPIITCERSVSIKHASIKITLTVPPRHNQPLAPRFELVYVSSSDHGVFDDYVLQVIDDWAGASCTGCVVECFVGQAICNRRRISCTLGTEPVWYSCLNCSRVDAAKQPTRLSIQQPPLNNPSGTH